MYSTRLFISKDSRWLTADCRSDKISEAVEKVDLILRWRQDGKTHEVIDWLSQHTLG
ncbi:hypothetical protein BDV11DRAFT_179702 [Aspergillus similis]